MDRLKKCLTLFLTFFKIGLFTFGGGYAMVAVIERDVVENKRWILSEDFLDLIAIAESTPGPLAINSATYIGYKVAGFFGALCCTLGVVLPSFIIIFVISLFFNKFMELEYVRYAFRGIQACVAYLIITAGLKMFKSLKKTVFNYALVCVTVGALVALELFGISFSTIYFILIGAGIGVALYLFNRFSRKKNNDDNTEKESKK